MPLTFVVREDWNWIAVADSESPELNFLSSDAQIVLECLKSGGAQFMDEVVGATGLLRTQVEKAFGELVSEGLVICDHFQALRKILTPSKQEKDRSLRGLPRRFRKPSMGRTLGGRWSIIKKRECNSQTSEARIENWAWQLLVRYGVVFRDLLERENLAPSWGELVRVYRRLEARGEIRGGRFIVGVSGEQFALSGTFEKLLKIREERAQGKRQGSYTVISSADPLNLVGIITPGPKISSGSKTRILFEEGVVTAVFEGNEIRSEKTVGEDRLRALRLVGTFRSVNTGTHPRLS
jgi:ATP-dependent Lhr-like helicase